MHADRQTFPAPYLPVRQLLSGVLPPPEGMLNVDIVSPGRRSAMMAGIKGRDTKPEFLVRRLAHRLGYRYRLHRRDLPGSPDLVFPARRKAIFVHGCFWHRHAGCRFAYTPKSNTAFWQAKFVRNVERDAAAQQKLKDLGWDVLIIWECETRDTSRLRDVLQRFLAHAQH